MILLLSTLYIEREVAYNTAQNVRNGDQIKIELTYFSAYGIKVTIEKGVNNREVLQSDVYQITESNTNVFHTIDVGDHVGEAHLRVYVIISEGNEYESGYLFLNVIE
jgi:hypothetical protein